jgi:hypothetical protein
MGRASRFLQLTRASSSGRFRSIERVSEGSAAIDLQYQAALLGRAAFDRRGKLGVGFGVFTGRGFTGGWNRIAGAGRSQDLYLKQLHLDVEPHPHLSVQVGGIDVAHGESTEITSYDYDGYLMGERFRYARAYSLFDSVSVTVASLGDFDAPSVFDRFPTLSDPNYLQVLWSKSFAGRVHVSADYTSAADEDTYRQAARVDLPGGGLVDRVHFENYQRRGGDPGYGLGVYGERRLRSSLAVGLGYARIDRSGLNSDRFPRGQRVYGTLHVPFGRELSLNAFFSQAIDDSGPASLRRRFDFALSYNVHGRLPLHENR